MKNQQIIREILESKETPSAAPSYDEQILGKLRGLYTSCMDEDLLNEIGTDPLIQFARTVKKLFKGKHSSEDSENEKRRKGLTAALAFVHSRGLGSSYLRL